MTHVKCVKHALTWLMLGVIPEWETWDDTDFMTL